MIIMRQNFGDAVLPHRLHRNAISQAISLVGACLVEAKTVKEGLMGLRAHDDARVGQNPLGIAGGSRSYRSSLAAEMSQELGQDFFRSDNRSPA